MVWNELTEVGLKKSYLATSLKTLGEEKHFSEKTWCNLTINFPLGIRASILNVNTEYHKYLMSAHWLCDILVCCSCDQNLMVENKMRGMNHITYVATLNYRGKCLSWSEKVPWSIWYLTSVFLSPADKSFLLIDPFSFYLKEAVKVY